MPLKMHQKKMNIEKKIGTKILIGYEKFSIENFYFL